MHKMFIVRAEYKDCWPFPLPYEFFGVNGQKTMAQKRSKMGEVGGEGGKEDKGTTMSKKRHLISPNFISH
jgi:hypothetical protein